ncbi:MAG TPA: hypothetical protein VFR41_15485 [Acidimicrobiia bacterium]|nr:hypothetical protein [Acidimicrobiia bacterium]
MPQVGVDVVEFGRALAGMTVTDIRAISTDLVGASASTADEVASTRSVLIIEQTLRRTHRLHNAAAAALAAATTVQDIAHRGHVALPDADVTRVARAAAQLARGLVAGDAPGMDEALRCLAKGWTRLPPFANPAAA